MASAFLEIACFNFESAKIAFEHGANRVELCMDKSTEGITPTKELITKTRRAIEIPLHVMIRPRAGSYLYNQEEFDQIKRDILAIKQMGVNGLVIGSLNALGQIDVNQNREMVSLAFPLPCTFHRAFDEIDNKHDALNSLIQCGYKTVLTSAGKKTALEGSSILKSLITQGNSHMVVMPGGGVRSSHVKELINETGATWVHSSAITDGGEIANSIEIRALLDACK